MENKGKTAVFRFYEELNDFLPKEKRKVSFNYHFSGKPAIKDAIESLGVPHTEVDLVIVNDHSVDFTYSLQEGDRVAVYPVFESLDISEITHLRAKPLRHSQFVLDVHLGKLARNLRLLGFDVLYERNYADEKIIEIAVEQKRIILTRDVGILKNGRVTHAHWLRNTDPQRQTKEILTRFDLYKQVIPFIRCLECNGLLQKVPKNEILDKLPLETGKFYQRFQKCTQCGKIYWEGSHFSKLKKFVEEIMKS